MPLSIHVLLSAQVNRVQRPCLPFGPYLASRDGALAWGFNAAANVLYMTYLYCLLIHCIARQENGPCLSPLLELKSLLCLDTAYLHCIGMQKHTTATSTTRLQGDSSWRRTILLCKHPRWTSCKGSPDRGWAKQQPHGWGLSKSACSLHSGVLLGECMVASTTPSCVSALPVVSLVG